MKKILIWSVGGLLFLALLANSTFASHQITHFRDNKSGAVSITFDDGYPSQVNNAVPLLNARNLKGTFFWITDWAGYEVTWEQWEQVAEQGHEIGSHTLDHPYLTTLSDSEIRWELSESQRIINENIPSQSCVSFSYPYTDSNEQVQSAASDYYIAARGGWVPEGGFLNHYEDGPSWKAVNFFNVGSLSCDGGCDLDYYANIAEQRHAWLCVHFHNVNDTNYFTQFLDQLLTKNVWVDTFGAIVRYMRERLSATLVVLSESSSEIKLNLTHSLDNSIYNESLTIRSSIPSSWYKVRVEQGESVYFITSVVEDTETVIYYDAVPNKGTITLTLLESWPTETVSTPPVLYGPASGTTGTPYSYTTGGSSSNLGDPVEYQFDWKGDGTDLSPWGLATQSKTWTTAGTYNVRAMARCVTHTGVVSPWSGSLTVNITQAAASVLELNFEEGSGSTALDSSGNGNNGTINGAVYTTDSAVGSYALSFDGNDSVIVPAKASLKPSNLSVAFWVKHTSDTSSSYGGSIQGAYGNGYGAGFRVLDYKNKPLAQVNFGDAAPVWMLGNSFVQAAWTHIVLTYDHAKIKLYQNGVLVLQTAETRNINWSTTSSSLSIGLSQWYFKGMIDKVKMYNYALSSQEVGQLYAEKGSVPVQYTLTVNTVGSGSVTKNPDKAQYNSGDVVQLSAVPATGWAFSGWSGDLTGSTNPQSITMNANKTVTATFVQAPVQYTLTVNTVGSGSVTKNPDKAQYNSGDVVQLTAVPATGWAFSGWSGDLTGSTNPQSITMNANKTVTATFVQVYTLTVNITGSGSVTKNPDKVQYNSGDVVQLTAVPATGWVFSGWSGDLTGSANPQSITMNANKTVTATFVQAPVQYTLTVNTVGSGSVTKNPDKAQYNSGDVVQLTAVPATGWVFSGWSGNLTGSTNPASLTMNANKTVTATFIQVYTLTVNATGSGSVTKNPDKAQYNSGDVVQLTAAPATGWIFSAWSGDLTGSTNPTSITMNANKTVTATFVPVYTLTVNITGSGSVTKNPDKAQYNSGDVVQLTAVPATGWVFSGWSGDLSGSTNPNSITMNGPKSVVANFTSTTNVTLLELNFEEGSGSTALDSSGNGNNGTINGAVYTTDSAAGSYALSFDGNDSVIVPAKASLKPSNLSVAFWVKHTSDTSSSYGGSIQGAYGNGYGAGFRVLDYKNKPLAQVNFGDAAPVWMLGNSFVQAAWTHIVLTYDHAKIRLYQNGVLVLETAETRNINWSTTSSNLSIGLAQWYFKGMIDKLKMYNYPLSSQEIGQLYGEKVK